MNVSNQSDSAGILLKTHFLINLGASHGNLLSDGVYTRLFSVLNTILLQLDLRTPSFTSTFLQKVVSSGQRADVGAPVCLVPTCARLEILPASGGLASGIFRS